MLEEGLMSRSGGGQTPQPNPMWKVEGEEPLEAAAQPLVQGLSLPRDVGRAIWLNNGGENLRPLLVGASNGQAGQRHPPSPQPLGKLARPVYGLHGQGRPRHGRAHRPVRCGD